jgi:dipeptidyl aminopeptidase/acylaminoacyl peptidase
VARLALGVLGLALLVAGSSASAPPLGGKIVFSVFAGLPVFQGDERCEGLYAVNQDGSGLVRVAGYANGRGSFYPGFSADGRTLSFGAPYEAARRDVPLATLYTLDAASGRLRRRSTFLAGLRPVWSPRGRTVLFPYPRKRRSELHALELPRGRERNLTPGLTALGGAWSPDARRIAFWTYPSFRPRRAVFTMNADGSAKRLLARDATAASWSPSGDRIAFFRPADRPSSLWLVDASGNARKLASQASPPMLWSPRGDALMLLRAGNLYRLDLDGGRERLVERSVVPLAWRPDGRILFLRRRLVDGEGVFGIGVARADGTRERLVGVTDEEDVNIGSLPAWQPVRAPLVPAAAPFAPRADGGRCVRLLAGLRSRLGG